MSVRGCARLWEVEAARDGMLDAEAAHDFRRHLVGCGQCARRHMELEELAGALRGDAVTLDQVGLRRARRAMLHNAARAVHGVRRMRRARAPALAAIGLALVAWAIGFGQRPALRSRAERFEIAIRSSEHAKWRRQREGEWERIVLDEGALRLRVRRSAGDPRLLVLVPDGEIEDLGTVFEVTVRNARTAAIAVDEGAVVFHPNGGERVRLEAGMTWSPIEHVAPVDAPVHVAAAAPQQEVTPRTPSQPRRTIVRAAPAPQPVAVAAEPVPQTQSEPEPVTPEVAAPAPVAAPPVEARASTPIFDATGEDGAYLRLLALLRERRNEEARLAAADYLRQFPNGFRRPEIERLLRAPR